MNQLYIFEKFETPEKTEQVIRDFLNEKQKDSTEILEIKQITSDEEWIYIIVGRGRR